MIIHSFLFLSYFAFCTAWWPFKRSESISECEQYSSMKIINFEKEMLSGKECDLFIKPYNKHVCQLRIDFDIFTLAQPQSESNETLYSCLNDKFVIKVANKSQLDICGQNSGQHVYISVPKTENTDSVITTLRFELNRTGDTVGQKRKWKIKITQLICETDFWNVFSFFWDPVDEIAPVGCLQYFIEKTGMFESFNYNKGLGPYMGNQNYAICFKRPLDAHGIRSKLFQLGYNNNKFGYTGTDCDSQFEDYPFIQDYLFIPDGLSGTGLKSSKFCSSSLSQNDTVSSNIRGPFHIVFTSGLVLSDVKNTQIGFKLEYTINENKI